MDHDLKICHVLTTGQGIYHEHTYDRIWWVRRWKTCKEQPCSGYLGGPSVRYNTLIKRIFADLKNGLKELLGLWRHWPVHKCVGLHINRDGEVYNLAKVVIVEIWSSLPAFKTASAVVIVKTCKYDHHCQISISMKTCILSLETVKAAAPSITSLSITCLQLQYFDPFEAPTAYSLKLSPPTNHSRVQKI